jgi:uncharacterized lipoprotein YbaY
LDRHGTNTRLDRTLGAMAVTDKPSAAIVKRPVRHQGQKGLGFRLDSLDEQALRACPQNLGQGIVDSR